MSRQPVQPARALRVRSKPWRSNAMAAFLRAATPPGAHECPKSIKSLCSWEEKAAEWCKEVGAVELNEVIENWLDLAQYLHLSTIELQQLAEASSGGPDLPEWLLPWLESLQLEHHATAAVYWCKSMGAADLADLIDCWEVFAADLQLLGMQTSPGYQSGWTVWRSIAFLAHARAVCLHPTCRSRVVQPSASTNGSPCWKKTRSIRCNSAESPRVFSLGALLSWRFHGPGEDLGR